jgi:hypothetical protein
MQKILIISILLIGSILSLSAQNSEEEKKPKQKIEKSNAILFAPFSMLNSTNPNVQFGYYRVVAPRWAVQLEVGVIVNFSLVEWFNRYDSLNTYKGFRIKTSAKYFVYNRKYFKIFTSPELYYYYNKSGITQYFWKLGNNFNYSDDTPEWAPGYFQFFHNYEQKIGTNFIAGLWVSAGKHLFFELHTGIGFAYRIVTHIDRINPNDKIYASFGVFDNASSNKFGLSLPINLKFGFRF